MKTTRVVNTSSIQRKWYIINAKDLILGRVASQVARLLIGKNKVAYSPNQDHGDNIIIVNSDEIKLSGKKSEIKTYFRHSEYPGGEKVRSFKEQMSLDSTKIIRDAVWGMVPKTALGRAIFSKLHVYSGPEHPHIAQKPEAITLTK